MIPCCVSVWGEETYTAGGQEDEQMTDTENEAKQSRTTSNSRKKKENLHKEGNVVTTDYAPQLCVIFP